MPRQVLKDYIKFLNKTAKTVYDPELKLLGQCAVANVKYLLGDLKESHALAQITWSEAKKYPDNRKLRWIASYAYYNTESSFLGKFVEVVEAMGNDWEAHRNLPNQVREDLETEIHRLSEENLLTINPISALHRNLVLFAAVSGSSEIYKEQYWPSKEKFQQCKSDEPDEIRWMKCWLEWAQQWHEKATQICSYDKAHGICKECETIDIEISLDLSSACAGFYYTALSLDSSTKNDVRTKAKFEAEKAFARIQSSFPPVSRYALLGFYGVYKLATDNKNPVKALTYLHQAAGYSEMSGNKHAITDILFAGAHAVAAARLATNKKGGRYLAPEVDYYLKEARKLAGEIGQPFFFGLVEAQRMPK